MKGLFGERYLICRYANPAFSITTLASTGSVAKIGIQVISATSNLNSEKQGDVDEIYVKIKGKWMYLYIICNRTILCAWFR